MRTILITFFALITLLYSCNKKEKTEAFDIPLRIFPFGDTSDPVSVYVYTNEEDYLENRNPVHVFKNIYSGNDIMLHVPKPGTKYYFDIYSEDRRTTNWAQEGSFSFSEIAQPYKASLNIDLVTNACYRRKLLHDNDKQSSWKMVSYLDEYGRNIIDSIPAYKRYRSLVFNRNRRATYSYLLPSGDTERVEYLFVVDTEFWAGISNSFNVTLFDINTPEGIDQNFRDFDLQIFYADGPLSGQHPFRAGYVNPPVPHYLIPETDSILLYSPIEDSANVIFKLQ